MENYTLQNTTVYNTGYQFLFYKQHNCKYILNNDKCQEET